jgi:hypothetical protein
MVNGSVRAKLRDFDLAALLGGRYSTTAELGEADVGRCQTLVAEYRGAFPRRAGYEHDEVVPAKVRRLVKGDDAAGGRRRIKDCQK